MYYNNKNFQLGKILILSLLYLSIGLGQVRNLHHVPPPNGIIGKDLILSASILDISDPIEATLYYRLPGAESFLEVQFKNTGFNWQATIPGFGLTEAGIEYLITFQFSEDRLISYPRVDPFNNPVFLQVIIPDKKMDGSGLFGELPIADVLILSPEPNEIVNVNELLIAASLFNTNKFDPSSVQLLLDGKDMTAQMTFEDGILILDPGLISKGEHYVQINMKDLDEQDMAPFRWTFFVGEKKQTISSLFEYGGRLNSRLSSEQVAGSNLNIAEIVGDFSVDVKWAKFNTDIRLTSRESRFTQPHNRFGTQFLLGNFLNINLGDFYPRFDQFTIDGKRVRGLGLKINSNWFNMQFINGELNRAVNESGYINGGYQLLPDLTVKNNDGSKIYYLDRRGFAFKRNIIGLKLSTNILSKLDLGFHFMKMRDDTASVKHVLNESKFSVEEGFGITPGNYTIDQFNAAIINSGNTLNNPSSNWKGQKPLDNLLIGFNMGTTFDDKKLKLDFNWNLSLFNRDIWDGAMSITELDTALDDSLDNFIGVQYDKDGKKIPGSTEISTDQIIIDPEKIKDIFIINTNMTPLVPIDLNSFKSKPFASIINMPSSAFNIRLRGNYGKNMFLVEYRQGGPEYVSLGNPFLRSNSRQFTISDRLSLVNRKLLLNFGFKHLDNKILKTTVNPLNTNTIFMNLTFLPGPGMPTFVINYQSIGKNNEKTQLDSVGGKTVDLREDSNASTNMMAITVPFRSGDIKQNIVISTGGVSNLDKLNNKRGQGYLFPKSDSKTFALNLSSIFPSELKTITQFSRTQLEIPSISQNKLIKTAYTWTHISVSANYRIFNDKVLTRGSLSMMNSQSKVSSQLFGFRLGADYKIQSNLMGSITGYLRVNSIPKEKNIEMNSSGIVLNLNYNF